MEEVERSRGGGREWKEVRIETRKEGGREERSKGVAERIR